LEVLGKVFDFERKNEPTISLIVMDHIEVQNQKSCSLEKERRCPKTLYRR
jgi:hypothetical protein